jgi:hypothetical protein
MGGDDEEARRRRAERVREQIEAERRGGERAPRTLRDFTERAAREAAEEERAAVEESEEDSER